MDGEKLSYDIPEFCRAHSISRSFLYALWQKGDGPERMRIGNRTLISHEAAERWRARFTETTQGIDKQVA
jgi:predicted DNA-binding transcriptional regulator AlpA